MTGKLTSSTTFNVIVACASAAPCIATVIYLRTQCPSSSRRWTTYCDLYLQYPNTAVNLLFFGNVCIGFWLVGLLQQSTWLIDLYWTIIPPLICGFNATHPHAIAEPARGAACIVLITAWSLRLTHSYLRREQWRLGAREDWRYADMRRAWGWRWWAASFVLVYAIQQAMLVGVTLPLAVVFSSRLPWRPGLDGAAAVLCLAGLVIADTADTQLYDYMVANEARRKRDEPQQLILQTGLWRFSRHPNYFGEQLFWWGLGLFGAAAGGAWALCGAAFNTLCMVGVTRLTERRMLCPSRRSAGSVAAYRGYVAATSMWVPWWPSRA